MDQEKHYQNWSVTVTRFNGEREIINILCEVLYNNNEAISVKYLPDV